MEDFYTTMKINTYRCHFYWIGTSALFFEKYYFFPRLHMMLSNDFHQTSFTTFYYYSLNNIIFLLYAPNTQQASLILYLAFPFTSVRIFSLDTSHPVRELSYLFSLDTSHPVIELSSLLIGHSPPRKNSGEKSVTELTFLLY